MLSFFHKPQENINEKFFYAFTFPFTYTECQNQLDRFDNLYRKSDEEIKFIMDKLDEAQATDNDSQLDVNANCEDEQSELDNFNEIEIETVQNQNDIGHLNNLSVRELENEIYFHRELLIKSIEGRRIDLITITSFNGIRSETEYRFSDLFPDENVSRCNLFKDKKVRIKYFTFLLVSYNCCVGICINAMHFIFRSFSFHLVCIQVKHPRHSF